MLFLSGDDILPAPSTAINPPSAGLPVFRIPGYGLQSKSLQAIQRGPSGKVMSASERDAPDAHALFLKHVRQRIRPIMEKLQAVPAKGRRVALKAALEQYRPGGADRVERMALKFIAKDGSSA